MKKKENSKSKEVKRKSLKEFLEDFKRISKKKEFVSRQIKSKKIQRMPS